MSELSKNCGMTPDSCLISLDRVRSDPNSEEHLIKLIKCLEKNTLIDNDLLTMQSSIILELRQLPGGYDYLGDYCDFLYNSIYKPWVLATRDCIDSYIEKFSSLCDAKTDQLLAMKRNSVYSELPDNEFLEGIKNLSVVFLLLEYADETSNYGYEMQASIVDKLNQILAEIEVDGKRTFKKLAKKRDLVDKRRLPKLYQQSIEYKLGCNCLCNSMFILSFLRILAKNERLGKYKDPRVYQNINALASEGADTGHTFLVVNLDPLNVSFNPKKGLYIECTAGWSERNMTGIPLCKLEGNQFMGTVFKLIEAFLSTSQRIVSKYNDRMYPIDSSKIYLNVVKNYLLTNPEKTSTWQKIWPDVFNQDIFDPILRNSVPTISMTQKMITTLEYIKKFNKVSIIYSIHRPILILGFLSRELADEVRSEVTYRDELLLEFLKGWTFNERPAEYCDILAIIKSGREKNGW